MKRRKQNPIDSEAKAPEAELSIVGIGASAGGVKALQELFAALPEHTGVAFVVVVHLDPEGQSELPRILASKTTMPVTQVGTAAALEADHVYVIPPNRRLRITDHELSAHPFDEPRGRRAPIDLFFRSLADQHGDGFAIILTGAGSDGAIGVKAVKEAGGIILVQDPGDAEYPSMPSSAIATGAADFILPVRELARQLAELAHNKQAVMERLRQSDEDQVRRILAHVRVRTGHDFSKYKRSTLLRRIGRRVQVTRQEGLADYYEFLRQNEEEVQALFNDLLISVTHFFRDDAAFEALAQLVIPQIFEKNEHLRVWVPGCATGEEAYSIAILLLEEAARREVRPGIQVFASDLDTGALATAREGCYPIALEADVSEERLRRFFSREGDYYRVKRELRDIILFANHSLLRDPPFSHLDLISCRNLLINLNRDLQQQACNTFHYALKPGGFLFLGSSETADSYPSLYRVLNREARIYQSTGESTDRIPIPPRLLAARPGDLTHAPGPRLLPTGATEAVAHRQALEKAAPPSVLVDADYRVRHLSDNAGRYLHPSGGPLTSDLSELVRPELRRAAARSSQGRGRHRRRHIAAVCHAPWLLIETGIIKGRKATSYKSIKTDVINAGAKWEESSVVTDQGIIASRNPGDLEDFSTKIVEEVLEGKHERRAA